MSRHRRYEELFPTEKQRLLAALGQTRQAIAASHAQLRPGSRTYVLGTAVADVIDDLAEHLTGDRTHFWAKPHARRG